MSDEPRLFRPAIGARGMTALHFAAYSGDLTALTSCLASGMDPDARDQYRGYTALHWLADMAATGGPRIEMLQMLARHGATLDLVAGNGDTAFALARDAGSDLGAELATALRRLGVKPDPSPNWFPAWLRQQTLVLQPPDLASKLGISRRALAGDAPLHGLRHPPEADTCGWYLWSGAWSNADDFFVPLHVQHLKDRLPHIVDLLGLPPGWRFMLAPDHHDLWYDSSLLQT